RSAHRHPRDRPRRRRRGRVGLHRSGLARDPAHEGTGEAAVARRSGQGGGRALRGRGEGPRALPQELPRLQGRVLPDRRPVGAVTGKLQAPKGTRDLLPPESEIFAAVEDAARSVFSAFGYAEIRTPVFEATELFARSVGETTDIVHKEMYTFPDRKGRSLTLRPENTAGVVRALVEAGLQERPRPIRLWYVGPQFRYEQPQAGRYREFRQIGAELIGPKSPAADAELLAMLFRFLERLGFTRLPARFDCVP